ncbi:MAG: hypothetical protein OXH31_09665 [Gammaproteobacteria bacterium]|nr:hypothetical protein [Gammaproteobacteria bacterium]
MGTSSSNKGTGSDTPLVPTFLDDDENVSEGGNDATPLTQTEPQRFRSARTNFSQFASSGGSNHQALRRAVRDYVRKGTGGARNAVRRMAPSLNAAHRTLSLLRSLQRDGVQETLLRINLQNLSGKSIQDTFTVLTDLICQDGGTIDDAIARDAWLETVAKLEDIGIDSLDVLTNLQIQEMFLSFVANSIVARLYQEIGVNGFKQVNHLQDIERFDEQFRNYIERGVRDSFSGDLSTLNMTDEEIKNVVDSAYYEAWSFFMLIGEGER